MTSTSIYCTPYTYLIGWTDQNKWYYGVRYGEGCHPSDLWKTYFTSSKIVKEFVQENGNPDLIEVRRIFKDKLSAKKWEDRILLSIPDDKKEQWLNKRFGSFKGTVITEEMAMKISNTLKGRKRPKQSEEWKKKRAMTHVGKRRSNSTKEKMRIAKLGKPQSAEHIKNAALAKVGNKLYWDGINPTYKRFKPGNEPKGWILKSHNLVPQHTMISS